MLVRSRTLGQTPKTDNIWQSYAPFTVSTQCSGILPLGLFTLRMKHLALGHLRTHTGKYCLGANIRICCLFTMYQSIGSLKCFSCHMYLLYPLLVSIMYILVCAPSQGIKGPCEDASNASIYPLLYIDIYTQAFNSLSAHLL